MDRAMAGGEDLWSDERKRPLILPIGMHFPGLCAKMPCGLCSAGGADIMIPAIIVGGHLAVAVADRPPVVNFEQTCREETTGEMRTNDKFEVCIADEKRARDQLAAQWSSFDPAARTRCARTSTSGHAASYLELLVCLELDQADREVHGQGSTTGIAITEPGRPVGERDEATESSQSRPGPIAAPSRPAPVAAPSRPAPIPRSPQQPVARSAVGPPAAPPPAASPPISPSPPMSEPQPTSQAEVLQQSLCRSPLGYVLPGCR
jgi:hypothetical protein